MLAILRSLWPYLRPHRRTLVLAGAAMVGEIVTALLTPWPLKFVFDRVLLAGHRHQLIHHVGAHEVRLLVVITAVALAIAGADALFTYFDDQLTEVASQKAIFDLRRDVFAHLQRLSVAFHQSADTRLGDLLSRLNGDIGALQDLAADGVSSLVTNGLTLVLMAAVLLWLDWGMALLALLIVVPTALYARRATRSMRQAMRTARRQEGRVSAVLQESLAYVKLVQAYGREEHEQERMLVESDRSLVANVEAATLAARLGPTVSLVSAGSAALLAVLGVFQVVNGHITAGELLVFLSYVRSMQSPIRQLAKLSWAVSKAGASLERVDEVLERRPTVVERPGARTLPEPPRTSGGGRLVEFDRVTFGYAPGRAVLHEVSLSAAPGQLVALVGATGSGKSTLLSLLPRFYDPWGGSVRIDRVDIRDVTLRSLRQDIAVVLQDSLIFRATILENIAYGRPGASRDEILAAGEAAGVGAVAARLDDGYDTIVSEQGASLSGGEKQCIGIARALLKDAPVVILDEPTSAMDAHTERLVMAGIHRLLADRTAFVIAHRLSTVQGADAVAVLDSGQIVELDEPDVLLRNGSSRFAQLAGAQQLDIRRGPTRSRAVRAGRQ